MYSEYKLDAVLTEIIDRWGIPGLGVGIVQDNEIVYARGYGVQSLETRAPVTVESVFSPASVAKCFVASAMMQLAERGTIDLDSPLIQYLPYFKLDDDRYPHITLRQILSHTSGMPDMDEIEYIDLLSHPEYDEGAAERFVRGLSGLKLAASPGEGFLYSNIAYNVLGDLIAKVSGQTFEAYMKAHILHPAGMPDSTFLVADVDPSRLAVPHLRTLEMRVNPVYPYHRADAPSSFLHTNVTDMCHWCITCLNRGTYNTGSILTPASYDAMWTPVAPRGYPPLYEDMGLGWTLGHIDGFTTVSHGGAGFGWTAFLTLMPEKSCAAVILCNEESAAHEAILDAVIQAMLDREPVVGKVSWMVPITQALQAGGLPAAYALYDELKNSGAEQYFFGAGELMNLVIQLMTVHKLDLAIDVLQVNLRAFPNHNETYTRLAYLYNQKGEPDLAAEILQKAQAITNVR
jgi:CubicO group peptidase (beta-lactamase class C family)